MNFKAFIKRFQFEYLYNALRETFLRFPLSVICAVAFCLLSMMAAHDANWFPGTIAERLRVFSADGLAFFTAATLFAEGAGLSHSRKGLVQAAGALVLLAICFIPKYFGSGQLFFGAALSLSMIFAPYIRRNSTEDSVWYFNYCNGIGLAIAGISAFTFSCGLSAIVGSMNYLFPVLDVQGCIYGDIWSFGGLFFGPVAFMYQIPRQFDFEKEECVIPKGIFFIANYLAIPLILIYTFILYVYAAKIVALWELPKGNLAYMVTGFGSLGIAARLAVFPMRQNGTVLLQQFYKYFFYLLLIPLALLTVGIYTRISAYGITEDRYAIVLCLVWLAALSAYYFLKPKQAHIKHVPMVLAVLCLLASFGPWSAEPVSTASQVKRLYALLEKSHLLVNGQVVKATKDVPFEERKDISAALEYIYGKNKQEAIEPLVAPFKNEIEDEKQNNGVKLAEYDCDRFIGCYWGYYERMQRVMHAWGMEYVSQYATEETSDYIEVQANYLDWNNDNLTKVSPYDYIVRLYAYSNPAAWNAWQNVRVFKQDGKEVVKIRFILAENGDFTVIKKTNTAADSDEGPRVVFPLLPMLEKFHAEHVTQVPEGDDAKVTLSAETEGLKAQVRVSELRGRMKDGKLVIENAQLTVLVSP